jgi:hypothetical protein
MNHRHHFMHARALSGIASVAFAFAMAAGCSSGQGAGSTTTGSYEQELTTDLGVCSVAHDTCLQASDGDVSKIDSCKSEASDCRDAVQAAAMEVHTAIRACATTARTCFMSVADGGSADRKACGQQLRMCVDAALPPPPPLPPCAATLKQCLQSAAGDAGTSTRETCVSTFHTCVDATLPPCMHELATCLEDRSAPRFACEREANQCRKYRFTHDGGLPPAPTGTTPPAPTGTTPPAPTGTTPPAPTGTTPPAPTSTTSPEPSGSAPGPMPPHGGPWPSPSARRP